MSSLKYQSLRTPYFNILILYNFSELCVYHFKTKKYIVTTFYIVSNHRIYSDVYNILYSSSFISDFLKPYFLSMQCSIQDIWLSTNNYKTC